MLLGSPARCWLLLSSFAAFLSAAIAEDVIIQSTAPEIVYSPPACNASVSTCQSAWCVTALNMLSGTDRGTCA